MVSLCTRFYVCDGIGCGERDTAIPGELPDGWSEGPGNLRDLCPSCTPTDEESDSKGVGQ